MNHNINYRLLALLLLVVLSSFASNSFGQNTPDTLKGINLYRPQFQKDTSNARLKYIQDSIFAREQFVRDSIIAREQFVRDSIARRQRMRDSVVFLQGELQYILEAAQWTMNDDLIAHAEKIALIGDSMLGDFVYYKLPFMLSEPYTPWKGKLNLNSKGIRFIVDQNAKKIKSIQAPFLKCNLTFANQGRLLVIQEDYNLKSNYNGSFYIIPIDSVFYDNNKRIVKIKRYAQYYKQEANYRKGDFLFTNLLQVKQYQYGMNNQLSKFELVKFRDRQKVYDSNDVGSIVNYSISKQNNSYLVTRQNNPANTYSDGIFKIDYDNRFNITCITFSNLANVMVWQRFVEVNKDGNVSCYIEKKDGVKRNSICMEYHPEPGAKYPVEIISTVYEKDGVDMFQKNITTQKSRSRNKLTMEYGPWQ